MSIITSLTRMWLTRSTKPFIFKNEYDNVLSYQDCDNLGLYVHIPFCRSICNFCPYCKVRYSKDLCDRYIDALLREIHAVGGQQSVKRKRTACILAAAHRPLRQTGWERSSVPSRNTLLLPKAWAWSCIPIMSRRMSCGH